MKEKNINKTKIITSFVFYRKKIKNSLKENKNKI